jgi:hypothetical protein
MGSYSFVRRVYRFITSLAAGSVEGHAGDDPESLEGEIHT